MTGYLVNSYIPVEPVSLPRSTTRSWKVRAKSFMRFRDECRIFLPQLDVPISQPVSVQIELHEANPRADIDNIAKAILDTLVGPVLQDDTVSIVVDLRITLSNEPKSGWSVRIFPLEAP